MAMHLASRGIGGAACNAFALRSARDVERSPALDSFLRGRGRKQEFHAGFGRTSAAETVTTTAKVSDVKPYEQIPGPKALPLLGNFWLFLPLIGEFYGLESVPLQKILYKRYGPILKIGGLLGRQDLVFAFRPEDVEVTFRNEGPWPSRGVLGSIHQYRQKTRKDYYGSTAGVLVENGPKWLEIRKKVNPPLMQPRISKRYVGPIADVAQEFIDKIRTLRDHKDELPANFDNELFKWSLESIAFVALDARLGCLAPVLTPDSEPQRMINAVHVFFDCLFALEQMPLWKLYPTSSWKKFVKAQDTFLEISVKYVDEAMERVKRRQEEGDVEDRSVLEKLLERTNTKEAAVMAQDLLFGGIDTTAYSVASALYMMSKNQDKQALLFKELKSYLPDKNSAITDEIFENMKYLKSVVKETLRMEPPFTGTMRVVPKEIVLSGYKIPAGTVVVLPNRMSNYSEDIHPMSERFIPEMWLKSRPTEDSAGSAEDFDLVNKTKKPPFAFLPFGFGPRSCIGKRFADMEIEILLAKIVRNFQVEYMYGDMEFESKVLQKPKDPLRFKMTDRNE